MEAVPNESYWVEALDRSEPSPSLSGAQRFDVACVGGGYTGLVTAYLLKKRDPGLRVAVLESRYVGFGSSGRNAGMVLQEPHVERIAARGADAVRFTYDETARSVDFIEELSRDEGFDCELERTGFLDIALLPEHERDNEEKQRRAASAGIELETVDREAMRGTIASDRFRSALLYPKAAYLHPGKYVSGLAAAARRRGVEIFEGTPVTGLCDGRDAVELDTPGGRILAEQAVVGLNAYLPSGGLGPVRRRAVSLFSFILLTEPLAPSDWNAVGWAGRQGYADKRRVHNYVRLTGDRLLFGGRVRYRFGLSSPRAIDGLYEQLRAEMLETFPSLAHLAITHRWCGPVAISHSRRPYIGRTGRVWTAHAYSGLGVSWATLSGRVLADLIVGREEPWRELLYLSDPMRPLPPEPLTFLGFQAGYHGMRMMDFLDRFR